ncbi:MAG: YbaB/EbfC family nucleoid-associated protein [Planctomycetes bacterium]|nr:YbaB/EbfC family nucleoid-associated protein [Planctomycetota bacterium]
MAGSLGDLGGLLRQAQKMQKQMADLQEDLAKREFHASAGGGVVRATVNGARHLVGLKIDPQVVEPEEVEMLEDLVRTAVSEALKEAEDTSQSEIQALTGGAGFPGMM